MRYRVIRAVVQSRGLGDPVTNPDLGPDGIENQHGHRNGLAKASRSKLYHFHDNEWRHVVSRNQLVPDFGKYKPGSAIKHFPSVGEVIYVLVEAYSRGKHGPSPEVLAWCTADQYEKGIRYVCNQQSMSSQEPLLIQLILGFIAAGPRYSDEQIHDFLLELAALSPGEFFYAAVVQHYILGYLATLANSRSLPATTTT